jgi:hypothetical protein
MNPTRWKDQITEMATVLISVPSPPIFQFAENYCGLRLPYLDYSGRLEFERLSVVTN